MPSALRTSPFMWVPGIQASVMLSCAWQRTSLMSMQDSVGSEKSKMAVLGARRGPFLQQAVVLLCRSSSALLALWPGHCRRHLLSCPGDN